MVTYWIGGAFNALLDESQCQVVRDWLDESYGHLVDDASVNSSGFGVGWVGHSTKDSILEGLIDRLPPGVSVSLTIDWSGVEAEDMEQVFLGPDADRLECAWLSEKITELETRRQELLCRVTSAP